MSERRTSSLSRAITNFRIAVEGLNAPDDVVAILNSIDEAIFSEQPVTAFNKSIGQLRRQRPKAIQALARWLELPSTIERASSSGCHWAWLIWCVACKRLIAGDKAHVAFGMSTLGRPPSNTFTVYEDAAILAESRSRFVRSETATSSVVNPDPEDTYQLNRREVQRHREVIRSTGFDESDIHEQARLVRLKRRKS